VDKNYNTFTPINRRRLALIRPPHRWAVVPLTQVH